MLPNLIVIGAMKGGTSSLHSYLDLHPEISMSRPKELDFFVLEKNWPRGIEWYESHFTEGTKICGESSPSYTKCHFFGGVPERMHSVVPQAKLIYVLRDPVERIVSHYVHNIAARWDDRSFPDALKENTDYISCSRYYMQLEQYLDYFPRSHILTIASEDLYRHRRQTLQKVFQFLGVDDAFSCDGFSDVLHKSSAKRRRTKVGQLVAEMPGRKILKPLLPFSSQLADVVRSASRREIKRPVLTEKLKQELIDALKDDVELLRRYTGSDFEDWCL
jgi:hypothetical protein